MLIPKWSKEPNKPWPTDPKSSKVSSISTHTMWYSAYWQSSCWAPWSTPSGNQAPTSKQLTWTTTHTSPNSTTEEHHSRSAAHQCSRATNYSMWKTSSTPKPPTSNNSIYATQVIRTLSFLRLITSGRSILIVRGKSKPKEIVHHLIRLQRWVRSLTDGVGLMICLSQCCRRKGRWRVIRLLTTIVKVGTFQELWIMPKSTASSNSHASATTPPSQPHKNAKNKPLTAKNTKSPTIASPNNSKTSSNKSSTMAPSWPSFPSTVISSSTRRASIKSTQETKDSLLVRLSSWLVGM